jgi:hypothetical protein
MDKFDFTFTASTPPQPNTEFPQDAIRKQKLLLPWNSPLKVFLSPLLFPRLEHSQSS